MGQLSSVKLFEKKSFSNEKGKVVHILRKGSEDFCSPLEVYGSWVNPGVIKGWKLHKRIPQRLSVLSGKVKLVVFEEGSDPLEFTLDENSPSLLFIPTGVWYAWQCLSPTPALLLNCIPEVHDPSESQEVGLEQFSFQYDGWT